MPALTHPPPLPAAEPSPRAGAGVLVLVLALSSVLVFLAQTTAGEEPPPGAFELVDRALAGYTPPAAYHDRGEIEVREAGGPVLRFSFETAARADGSFRLVLDSGSGAVEGRTALWRLPDGRAFRFDGHLGSYRPLADLAGELPALVGDGGQAALLVPLALAGGALPTYAGAAVDGEEPCGDERCVRIVSQTADGATTVELLLARPRLRVREVVVEHLEPEQVVARALRPGATGGPAATRITVRHRELPALEDRELAFALPPGTREERGDEPGRTAGAAPPPPADDAAATFAGAVEVQLHAVVVRVLGPDGAPLVDLGPDQLRVEVGDREARVEGVEWVSAGVDPLTAAVAGLSSEERAAALHELAEAGLTLPAPGRVVLFFVQADWHPSRVVGHLRVLRRAEELLDSFTEDDRFAVVSYDSRLKLRLDLARSRDRVVEALREAFQRGPAETPYPGAGPSLARHLDLEEAARAHSAERALELTARALAPLPGDKLVVFVGYGLGEFGPLGVQMTRDYPAALQALYEARATVFVLDVSDADYHSLEVGLEGVAHDTGGSYAKTHLFPAQAIEQLAATTSGHYVLYVRAPEDLEPGRHRLRVELRGQRGEVLQPTLFIEAPADRDEPPPPSRP